LTLWLSDLDGSKRMNGFETANENEKKKMTWILVYPVCNIPTVEKNGQDTCISIQYIPSIKRKNDLPVYLYIFHDDHTIQ
jgi:hypothetical protein